MKRYYFILWLIIFSFPSIAQDFPYRLHLDSISIPGLGGLQSYSFGQANGKWLIIGGRLDGLHQRQPWATFDLAGHNNQLIVVDPTTKQKWSMPISELDNALQEQLSSTNIQFFQRENNLFLIGGYGFSKLKVDHITFPNLTVVNVKELIEAIISKRQITPYFQQIIDEQFAVTGGQLLLANGIFQLVGGHRFDGRYNPMDNPTFVQTYTNEVRRFKIEMNGMKPTVQHLPSIRNEKLMHRRDFNVLPSILPNNSQGVTAFSGVFQEDVNLPYLDAIRIDATEMSSVANFAQYYNHYHCASIAIHDADNQRMHNLFFGGIAHYYDSSGVLVQDNDVPFTQKIGHVVTNSDGSMQEYLHPLEMPGYLGAASEFIPASTISMYENEVVNMNELKTDTVLLGYIYGGIQSSAANIFWINTGVESRASQMIYPLYLIKNSSQSELIPNPQSANGLQLQVFPDPIEKEVSFGFFLKKESLVSIRIQRQDGKVILSKKMKKLSSGEQLKIFRCRKFTVGQQYMLIFEVNETAVNQLLIVR